MPAPDSASPQHLAPLALRGQRIIVTRPAPDAERWVAQLRERGLHAEALPLLEITGADDPAPLQAAWNRLSDFAALMFVSGNAVDHFFDGAALATARSAHGP